MYNLCKRGGKYSRRRSTLCNKVFTHVSWVHLTQWSQIPQLFLAFDRQCHHIRSYESIKVPLKLKVSGHAALKLYELP